MAKKSTIVLSTSSTREDSKMKIKRSVDRWKMTLLEGLMARYDGRKNVKSFETVRCIAEIPEYNFVGCGDLLIEKIATDVISGKRLLAICGHCEKRLRGNHMQEIENLNLSIYGRRRLPIR